MKQITIYDNTQYVSGMSCNGGCYWFGTRYVERPDGKYNVYYRTSADFPYCPFCGSFYSGDSCSCGREEPDVVTSDEVVQELLKARRAIERGEDFEITEKEV